MSKIPTYLAWLPGSVDQLTKIAMEKLQSRCISDGDMVEQNHAMSNIAYIRLCLEKEDCSKLIGHHVTLFFNKSKNNDVVKEDDVLFFTFCELGWSATNVVFFGDVTRAPKEASINHLLENAERTHMTFSCDKARGGKPVDSGKVVPHIVLDEPIMIKGTVHELYTENSNKLHGGEPPIAPKKVPTKVKVLTPQQIFVNKLKAEGRIPAGNVVKDFTMHFSLETPTEEQIDEYIKNMG